MKRVICSMVAMAGIVLLGMPGMVLGEQPAGVGKNFDIPVQLAVRLGMALTKDLKATPEETDKRITAFSVFVVENMKGPGSIVGLIEKAVNNPKVLEPDGGVVLGVDPSCIDYCRGILKNEISCVVDKWQWCRNDAYQNCNSCCTTTPSGSTACGPSESCGGLSGGPFSRCMTPCTRDCTAPLYAIYDSAFHANIHSVWCEAIMCYCSCGIPSPVCGSLPATCPPPVICPPPMTCP